MSCERAVTVVRDSWPSQEPTRERVTAVRGLMKKQWRNGRSERYKIERKILREREQECRMRFLGMRVRYQPISGGEITGRVEDVRIKDGHIQYTIDIPYTDKTPGYASARWGRVTRDQLYSWEVVEDD